MIISTAIQILVGTRIRYADDMVTASIENPVTGAYEELAAFSRRVKFPEVLKTLRKSLSPTCAQAAYAIAVDISWELGLVPKGKWPNGAGEWDVFDEKGIRIKPKDEEPSANPSVQKVADDHGLTDDQIKNLATSVSSRLQVGIMK